MLIKQIGSVVLSRPIWWIDFKNFNNVRAKGIPTIDGGVHYQYKNMKPSSQKVHLSSRGQLQDKAVIDALEVLIANSVDVAIPMLSVDGQFFTMKFDYEKSPISASRKVESFLFDRYELDLFLFLQPQVGL